MKKLLLCFSICSISLMSITGCGKENRDIKDVEQSLNESKSIIANNDLDSDFLKIRTIIRENNITSLDEFQKYFGVYYPEITSSLRSASLSSASNEVLDVVTSIELFDKNLSSISEYELAYLDILDRSGIDSSSEEYKVVKSAIISSLNLYRDLKTSELRAFWSDWDWNAIGRQANLVTKCVGGTVGSAILGSLSGAGAGTFVLPVVGTISGTALGGYGGALVGAATFC